MSVPLEVVLVVPPLPPSSDDHPGDMPARSFHAYDRFAEDLQRETALPVTLSEGPSAEAKGGQILILTPSFFNEPTRPAPRDASAPRPAPLLLNASPSEIPALLETWSPAGVVSSERYSRWRLGQDARIYRQLHGLGSLAADLAPLLRPTGGPVPGYEEYMSDEVLSLPMVVARYIEAYWKDLAPADSFPASGS